MDPSTSNAPEPSQLRRSKNQVHPKLAFVEPSAEELHAEVPLSHTKIQGLNDLPVTYYCTKGHPERLFLSEPTQKLDRLCTDMFNVLCRCCCPAYNNAKSQAGAGHKGEGINEPDGDNFAKEQQRVVRANNREFNVHFAYAEQFNRLANIYFLGLMILQFIPQISSVPWYSTAIPLGFVLMVSAIKEGYDDIQRHRSDNQVNKRISYRVSNGRLEDEHWAEVKVGDVIRMENEHFIAGDLLLLSSSEPHGLCYIETAELDGETNLKTRSALPETASLGDKLLDISNFDGEIICEPPNNRLDKFEGKLVYKGISYPLSNNNMLLRGCRLKNTRWCYGVVVFAGKDTKLMRNSGRSSQKRTSLDRFLNILILGIVFFLLSMCLICTILYGIWEYVTGQYFVVYLPWDNTLNITVSPEIQIIIIAVLQFFSYIILLNTVVPISLYISVEMIRFMHSQWINFDRKMYDEKTDTPAKARTTTLNEELGQVQYIFTDKTGTLTQNIMLFRKCSINGRSYGELFNAMGEPIEIEDTTMPIDLSRNRWCEPNFRFYDKTLLNDTKMGISEVHEFWRLLALCHTVMPERKPGNILEYQAQSPDEAALVSAARNFGFVFKSRTPKTATIEVNGKEEVYDVLHILDFDNVRKRMSVIVQSKKTGNIKLYCKGADTMILTLINKEKTSDLLMSATMQHLNKFAVEGLRTLCIAYKNIDPTYSDQWMSRMKVSMLDPNNKESLMNDLYEEIETDLLLLGATAIEDKLQDGVPHTIANLIAANIKVWVLTGDKTETAINIGYSCKLLTDEMKEVFVIEGKDEFEVEVQLKDIKRRIERSNKPFEMETYSQPPKSAQHHNNNTAVNNRSPEIFVFGAENGGNIRTANGTDHLQPRIGSPQESEDNALVHTLKKKYERIFLEIATQCQSVICCRVTPLQKAQVVDLVKQNIKAVTLAIGDGANDVSMIRMAHIGVGISGKEGMQAVLSSDFSIGQFRFLERLLLVHGRWSYFRMCKFLRYFFYKNFSFTLTNFWYSFFCDYSAQTVFDPVMIACYNMFFTALPVLVMGIFDQDVNEEFSTLYPVLYTPGQFNLFFNMRIFIYSVIHGILSSLVLFFVPYGAFVNGIDYQGKDMNDYSLLAFCIFSALIVAVTGQIMFDTAYWTIFNHIAIFGSVLLFIVIVIVFYEVLPAAWLPNQSEISKDVVFHSFTLPQYWLCLLLTSAILLIPVLANRFFWIDTHPSYADRLRSLQGGKKRPTTTQARLRPSISRRSQKRSLRSGYAFSHSRGFGDMISKGTLFKNLENPRVPSFQSQSPIHEGSVQGPTSTQTQTSSESKKRKSQDRTSNPTSSPIESPRTLTTQHSSNPESNGATTFSSYASKKAGSTLTHEKPGNSAFIATRSTARRPTLDMLVIEHPPEPAEFNETPRSNDQQFVPKCTSKSESPSVIQTNNPRFSVSRGGSSPRSRQGHNIVVNRDDEDPLSNKWALREDGTLFMPELEHPPTSESMTDRMVTSSRETSKTVSANSTRFLGKPPTGKSSNKNNGNGNGATTSFSSKQNRKNQTQQKKHWNSRSSNPEERAITTKSHPVDNLKKSAENNDRRPADEKNSTRDSQTRQSKQETEV